MGNFVDTITPARLPEDQYVNEVYDKHQIYLHHTASSGNPYGVLDYWASVPERVAAAFIIAGSGKIAGWKDGEIIQCFPSNKAAWHLGLTQKDLNRGKPGNKTSSFLNLNTIAIEICNWGYLADKKGKLVTYAGNTIPDSQILEYPTPYRGYKHYQKYTDAQLESVRKLLLYLCDKYEIDKKFKGTEIFNIDPRALRGENGIFTHTSVRTDKYDCHPQPELIKMLESL